MTDLLGTVRLCSYFQYDELETACVDSGLLVHEFTDSDKVTAELLAVSTSKASCWLHASSDKNQPASCPRFPPLPVPVHAFTLSHTHSYLHHQALLHSHAQRSSSTLSSSTLSICRPSLLHIILHFWRFCIARLAQYNSTVPLIFRHVLSQFPLTEKLQAKRSTFSQPR